MEDKSNISNKTGLETMATRMGGTYSTSVSDCTSGGKRPGVAGGAKKKEKKEKAYNVQPVDAVLLHRLQHELHVKAREDDHQVATPNHDVAESDAITVAEWYHARHDFGLSRLSVRTLEDRKLHGVEDETVVRNHGEFLRCRPR